MLKTMTIWLSIPTLGASGFGYKIGEQFGHEIIRTSAALVPFVLNKKDLDTFKELSGVAVKASVELKAENQKIVIQDDMLFTHRGLSGPAILKISPYWISGKSIIVNFIPEIEIGKYIKDQVTEHGEQLLINNLAKILPKRLVKVILGKKFENKKVKQITNADTDELNYVMKLKSILCERALFI